MGKYVLNLTAIRSSSFTITTRAIVILVVQVAFLMAAEGTNQKHYEIELWKCCGVYEMLSSNGRDCIEAPWNRSESTEYMCSNDKWFGDGKIITSYDATLHSDWVSLWLPPGIPPQNINLVRCPRYIHNAAVSSVNASSFWDPVLLTNKDLWRNTVAFLESYHVARPSSGGGFRKAVSCVDAAPAPLGPFVMLVKTMCNKVECARKCCEERHLLKDNDGRWQCEPDDEGYWTPSMSSLKVFDQDFPHSPYALCERPRLLLFEERYAEWARHSRGSHHFYFYTWDTCFDFYRSSNASLDEGLFYCEFSRITRGVYWLLRPLCIPSALLLMASLLTIACNKTLRRKTHSHCLFIHAACLFAFNIGQVLYYMTISDRLDGEGKDSIPPELEVVCKYFALSSYFMLTSAWFWLTALCTNMARGFRLQKAHLNKGNGKRFLAISAFAWGLPVMLTITCNILISQPEKRKDSTWYIPSLMETRVCYIEPLFQNPGYRKNGSNRVPFMKSGTALFYYGPMSFLVMCNIISISLTLRKVHYLKRGNSVLRQEENQMSLGQRHTEGNTETGNAKTRESRNRSGFAVDAKTIKLYIKMVLLSGCVELLTEVIMWFTTHDNLEESMYMDAAYMYARIDRDLAFRAAGYVIDFFRAAVVTWLAYPEGGYLDLMRRLRRDKREKRSARVGRVGGRKQNVA